MDMDDKISIILILLIILICFISIPLSYATDNEQPEKHLLSFNNNPIDETVISDGSTIEYNIFQRIWFELRLSNYLRIKELRSETIV